MSYSTWHFITPPPSLGWFFRNMVLPRFVSLWQAMLRRHNDMCDLNAWILSQDGCFINTVHCAHVYNTQQTPTTNYTPHRADGIDGTCFDDALRPSWRLRLCYYVVGSPLLPPFVCPGRARASDLRRADDLLRPATLLLPRQHFLLAVRPSLGTPLDHSELQSL